MVSQVPTSQELELVQNSSIFCPSGLLSKEDQREQERRNASKDYLFQYHQTDQDARKQNRRGRRQTERRKIPKVLKMQPVFNQGHIALLGVFGTDESIADSARTSYEKGTKKTSNDENLLRYLVRKKHTSPLEQAEVRFQVRIPEIVFRQMVRHRTANLNVESFRYSEVRDDFYIPHRNLLQKQSNTNNQGRGEQLQDNVKNKVLKIIEEQNKRCYGAYTELLDLGLAREIARSVINGSVFVKIVWKCDLHNFFHFLNLRLSKHAQVEIRIISQIMYHQVKDCFPKSFKAFEDYILNARTYSKQELIIIDNLLQTPDWSIEFVNELGKQLNMSKREIGDFIETLPNKNRSK